MYPAAAIKTDALDAAGKRTVMDDAYRTWLSLCSIMPWPTAEDPNCTFAYSSPAGGTPPQTTPAPPPASNSSGGLPSCVDYQLNAIACSQKVTSFGINAERERLDAELGRALEACARAQCDQWPGGGTIYQVSICSLRSSPRNPQGASAEIACLLGIFFDRILTARIH